MFVKLLQLNCMCCKVSNLSSMRDKFSYSPVSTTQYPEASNSCPIWNMLWALWANRKSKVCHRNEWLENVTQWSESCFYHLHHSLLYNYNAIRWWKALSVSMTPVCRG